MRSVVQRVSEASVTVDGEVVGAIERGLVILVGVQRGDTEADARATGRKIGGLRIFPSDEKAMDRALADVGGACLVISQFTLAATITSGRRPGLHGAEDPALASVLVERVVHELQSQGLPVAQGRFGAHMQVALVNDGPATLLVCTEAGKCV